MTQTALERARLVVGGDRGELVVEDGRVTIAKQAPTREAPTTVDFGVDEVRSTHLQAPSRGSRGWLHVGVVGGSPRPPGELAALGDPYTLPVTSRSWGAARRFAKLVERHVQERGMPHETGPTEGRLSSGVALTSAPGDVALPAADPPQPPPPPPPPPPAADPASATSEAAPGPPDAADPADLVTELRALADLRASGALTEEEFQRAKARVLGGAR